MDKEIINKLKSTFDDIVHIDEDGNEFWYARELQLVLGYTKWDNFIKVINKAKTACENSEQLISIHFPDVKKMVDAGVAQKNIGDIMLTRYACYLIAQNGDSRKEEIAFAQSYFAVQTRKAEIIEQRLNELNRVQLRNQLKTSERRLSQNIYERGVNERGFGRIRSKGDTALFGGHSTQDMKKLYNVKTGPLADHLPAVTIAAKNLATEMTNLNVEQKDLFGESPITTEHVQNNASVRKMLSERDILPENLPPDEDTKKIERRMKSDEKKLALLNK